MRKFLDQIFLSVGVEFSQIRPSLLLALVWITICPDFHCFEDNPDIYPLINLLKKDIKNAIRQMKSNSSPISYSTVGFIRVISRGQ